MEHNIPLIRRIYEQITQHPETHDQSSWRTCVAGWAVRLNGEHALLMRSNSLIDGLHAINLRTGAMTYTDDLATGLLGMTEEEAAGLFGVTESMAVGWLEDIIVEHDMREIDALATGFDADDYPIGEVRG